MIVCYLTSSRRYAKAKAKREREAGDVPGAGADAPTAGGNGEFNDFFSLGLVQVHSRKFYVFFAVKKTVDQHGELSLHSSRKKTRCMVKK